MIRRIEHHINSSEWREFRMTTTGVEMRGDGGYGSPLAWKNVSSSYPALDAAVFAYTSYGGWVEVSSNMKWDPNDANAAAGNKPCCGGGYGTKQPVYRDGKWHDSDCSTNYPSVDIEKLQKEVDAIFGAAPEFRSGPRCECGADKVYGAGNVMHSATMPCPLYRKP